MRTLVLLASLSMIAVTFALTPADAFGYCTKPGVAGHTCHSHYVCIGWGYDYYGEHCQYGIGEPICECMPIQVLYTPPQPDALLLA